MISPVIEATQAWVALGSNLGEREQLLQSSLRAMDGIPGTQVERVSDFFETVAVGPGIQGKYLNAAVALRTTLTPRRLLESLLNIEAMHGRRRHATVRWEARTLDLDLLMYGTATIREPGLCVPHPRMHQRFFVLEPLAQIAPEIVHPVINRTISELLGDLQMESANGNFCPSGLLTDGIVGVTHRG